MREAWGDRALAGRDEPVQSPADRVLELGVAERAADQFASPQRREGGVVRVRVEEVGEARHPVDERLHPHEPVVTAGQMRSDAGMGPIPGALGQPRPHRIERHDSERPP